MSWTCEVCKTENPDNESFCLDCGNPNVENSTGGGTIIVDPVIPEKDVVIPIVDPVKPEKPKDPAPTGGTIIVDRDPPEESGPTNIGLKPPIENNTVIAEPVQPISKIKLHLFRNGAKSTDVVEIFGEVVVGKFSTEKGPVDIDIKTLNVPDDEYISRHHAKITFINDRALVEDADSTNGTWVNNIKIDTNKRTELHSGDIVCFANTKFEVEY